MIGDDRRQALRHARADNDALPACLRLHELDAFRENVRQLYGLEFQVELAGFDLREIE